MTAEQRKISLNDTKNNLIVYPKILVSELVPEIDDPACIRNLAKDVRRLGRKRLHGFANNDKLTLNCGSESLSVSYCSGVNLVVAESIA